MDARVEALRAKIPMGDNLILALVIIGLLAGAVAYFNMKSNARKHSTKPIAILRPFAITLAIWIISAMFYFILHSTENGLYNFLSNVKITNMLDMAVFMFIVLGSPAVVIVLLFSGAYEPLFSLCPYCKKMVYMRGKWVCHLCGTRQKTNKSAYDNCSSCGCSQEAIVCEHCDNKLAL